VESHRPPETTTDGPPLTATLFLVAALGGLLASAAPSDQPAVVDRVVAVVGERIITASDVALEGVLSTHDPSPVAAIQSRRFDPLNALIELAIARGLAGDVAVYQPSATDVRERLGALRGQYPDPRDWQTMLATTGHTEEQLAGALYSHIVAERYVGRNVTSPAVGAENETSEAAKAYAMWVAEQRHRVAIRIVPAFGSNGTPSETEEAASPGPPNNGAALP
jgi:hypothetical protein